MKKLSETIHPALKTLITIVMLALWPIVFYFTGAYIAKLAYPMLDNNPRPGSIISQLFIIILPVFIGWVISTTVFITLSAVIEVILGKPIPINFLRDSYTGHFADKYTLSDKYVIAHAFNHIDCDAAIIRTRLRLSFSYQEIEAFHNLMRYKKVGCYTLENYDIPYPVTSLTPAISRHTTRQLLRTMRPDQYVSLNTRCATTIPGFLSPKLSSSSPNATSSSSKPSSVHQTDPLSAHPSATNRELQSTSNDYMSSSSSCPKRPTTTKSSAPNSARPVDTQSPHRGLFIKAKIPLQPALTELSEMKYEARELNTKTNPL